MSSSRLSILLISIFFPPEIGGGSTGAWNRAMLFHKLGYSVFILCGFPSYPSGKVTDPKYKGKFFFVETIGPFTVIRLRLIALDHTGLVNRFVIFFNFIFVSIFFMPRILKVTGKISLTYARAPILFSSFIGSVYAKFTNSFFVLEMPDLWPEELVTMKIRFTSIVMSIGTRMAKLAYSLPDTIITISESAAEIISSKYQPKAPVYGLPVGVDPSGFPNITKHQSRMSLIEKNVFPKELENKFIILYSGIISPAQQVENLAYVAEKLKTQKDLAIVVIGQGEVRRTLEVLKKEQSLDNFYLLPSQPRNLMPEIIASADVCSIMLSSEQIFEIALPTKFYEYLASKKPILGICKGELARIIEHSNIGIVAESVNAEQIALHILKLKDSPELLGTMEKNCQTVLQRFSLEKISNDLSDILTKEARKTRLDKKLKICLITSWFPSNSRPNIAPFVYNFAKNLEMQGVEVSVIAPRISNEDMISRQGNMTVYRVSRIMPLFSIIGLINKTKPDILHVHAPNFFSSNAIIAARLMNLPIVATVHRAEIDEISGLLRLARKIILDKFDKIIAVSNFTRSLALKAGAKEDKITTIYNSCNEELFLPKRKLDLREKLALPKNKKIILYVGNLVKIKGVYTLIESCRILRSNTQDFLVLIIGDGFERKSLESLVASYGLADEVKFLNWMPPSELPKYYNAADVFVLPSLSEGHSVALLEAMASGLPIVASIAGGNKETIEEGSNGFLFDVGRADLLAEKIQKILTDTNLHNHMSLNCSETYTKKFSTKIQIQNHLTLYQTLLNHHS